MTGPSARGSLKGIPSSISSPPPEAQARRSSTQPALVGYPAVTKGRRTLRMGPGRLFLLVVLDDADVLVAPAGDVDHEDLPLLHGGSQLFGKGDRVRGFQGGHDALLSREAVEGGDRLVVRRGDVGDAARVPERRVLGADPRVVQPGRDRVRGDD